MLQIKGVSANSFYIYLNELMQLGERLEVLQLGDWCMIWETKNLFDRSTFEDVRLALEDKFVNALIEKMQIKFLEEQRKK